MLWFDAMPESASSLTLALALIECLKEPRQRLQQRPVEQADPCQDGHKEEGGPEEHLLA